MRASHLRVCGISDNVSISVRGQPWQCPASKSAGRWLIQHAGQASVARHAHFWPGTHASDSINGNSGSEPAFAPATIAAGRCGYLGWLITSPTRFDSGSRYWPVAQSEAARQPLQVRVANPARPTLRRPSSMAESGIVRRRLKVRSLRAAGRVDVIGSIPDTGCAGSSPARDLCGRQTCYKSAACKKNAYGLLMHRFGDFNLKTIAPNGKPAQIRLGKGCDIEMPDESEEYDCEQANDLPDERYRAEINANPEP